MSWTDVAAAQAGLIARSQLVAADVPVATVGRWVSSGRLERTPGRGVYQVAGAPIVAERGAWLAALTTRSVISYSSAARWWEMPVEDDGLVHVTRLDRRRLDWPAGVRVHRVGLDRAHIVRRRGLWVTTRAETTLDCIGWLPPGRALTLAHRARQQGWLGDADVARRLETSRWGNTQIRRIVGQLAAGADAESERRLHALMRQAGLIGWVPQYPFVGAVGRFVLDVAFPRNRLAIEVDGYRYHCDDGRFQQDRTRQNAMIAAGWRVLRFTWADIVDRPEYVVTQIRLVVAA